MAGTDADAPEPALHRSATRVWQNDDLRDIICAFADDTTLARIACVDDGGLRSGSKLLWGTQRPVKEVEVSLEKVTDEVSNPFQRQAAFD